MAGYDLYLSYSGRKCYFTCPKKYFFSYELRIPQRWSLFDSAFGKAIGKVFEWFYNRQTWAAPDVLGSVMGSLEAATRAVFVEEKASVDENRDLFLKTVDELHEYVPRMLEVVRKHRLLTESSRSEVDLTVEYSAPGQDLVLKLGGRTDFIHQSNRNVSILDGKGSQHREKYVDPEQLIWYAVLHYLRYGVAPSKLGFLYYRFPADPVQWVSYDADAMRASVRNTFEVAKNIKLKMFEPKTGPECVRCDYQSRCEEGQRHVSTRKIDSGGRVEDSLFGLETI